MDLVMAIGAIAGIVFFFKHAGGKRCLKDMCKNRQGDYSLSKLQFLLWTLVIAFSFLTLQIIRIANTEYEKNQEWAIQDFPANLLALMGISVSVPIISAKIGGGKAITTMADGGKAGGDMRHSGGYFKQMFEDGSGRVDLARFQMFLWTVIAIGIYLYVVFDQLTSVVDYTRLFLPDTNPTMLVLMGLSQGAYLGSKYASSQQNPQKT